LKYRHEFTGYKTREIRPETPAKRATTSKPDTVKAPDTTAASKSKSKSKPADKVDWLRFKKEAAEAIGKPFNKTTKADVLKYLDSK
jgi:hypothetical protein